MRFRREAPLCLALFALFAVAACTPARVRGPGQEPRFYKARPYGSERQFNPISQIVNEGFNNLWLQTTDLSMNSQNFGRSLANLEHAVANARTAYRNYGWHRALTNELFPLTAREGGQWLPNYQDHLLGSGMVSARMAEWFAHHGWRYPLAMSYATMTVSHILNEVVERPNPLSVDAITDLLIFDNLGFLLFRSDRVQRAFSGPVTLTSWAWQPVVTAPGYFLENAGQSFVLGFPLPRTTEWRGFYFYGVTHVAGVSRVLGNGRSLSVGAGWGATNLAWSDSTTDTRTVGLGSRAGVFYDHQGSLLASLLWEGTRGTIATLNVYPGLLNIAGNSPGLWLAIRKYGGHRFGLTMPFGMGFGYGHGEVR